MLTCARKLTSASLICRLKWTLLIVAAKQATWPIHCHLSREENGEQARMEARGGMGRENEMGEHERGKESREGKRREEKRKRKKGMERRATRGNGKRGMEGEDGMRGEGKGRERERSVLAGACIRLRTTHSNCYTTSATGNTHAAINNCLWFRGRECVMEDE